MLFIMTAGFWVMLMLWVFSLACGRRAAEDYVVCIFYSRYPKSDTNGYQLNYLPLPCFKLVSNVQNVVLNQFIVFDKGQ